MLNKKQKEIYDKVKPLQTNFAGALVATKGTEKERRDNIIKTGYALCDSNDALVEMVEALIEKLKISKAQTQVAVSGMQTRGRKLKALENAGKYQNRTFG